MFSKVVAGLLFLAAIAELAVTLAQDYGPSSDSTTLKNPAVFYTNPVLFAVSWVCSVTYYLSKVFEYIFKKCALVCVGDCDVVSRVPAAQSGFCGLWESLHLLGSHSGVRDLSVPDVTERRLESGSPLTLLYLSSFCHQTNVLSFLRTR